MTVLSSRNFGAVPFCIPVYGTAYVETGVGLGDSMLAALEQPFVYLDGIDCSAPALGVAMQRLPRDGRLTLHEGSSPDALPKVCRPERKTVFFLDAHVEPGPGCYDPKYGQCPLLDELKVILSVPWRELPVLLIDDAAAFLSHDWWETAPDHLDRLQWPIILDIYDTLGVGWSYAVRGGILYCWKER